jgi:hypothetical protein
MTVHPKVSVVNIAHNPLPTPAASAAAEKNFQLYSLPHDITFVPPAMSHIVSSVSGFEQVQPEFALQPSIVGSHTQSPGLALVPQNAFMSSNVAGTAAAFPVMLAHSAAVTP